MLTIPPVISDFSFVTLNHAVDIYAIFTFELLHNQSLGISRLLKECTTELRNDRKICSSSMISSSGELRYFFSAREVVF